MYSWSQDDGEEDDKIYDVEDDKVDDVEDDKIDDVEDDKVDDGIATHAEWMLDASE